jgi:hypothetical protein
MLLDAREREILENHLIGEVSAHLHDGCARRDARARDERGAAHPAHEHGDDAAIRVEPLDDGPRACWTPCAPAAHGATSPAERQALGAFLQERVRAVRTANDTGRAGTWPWPSTTDVASVLRGAQQDGVWRRLTRRTHGTGSGGEKAIALTIPSSPRPPLPHRRSAGPRLILLDEAFVGIDKSMRAQCMGLLRAFDLDFVMTSEQSGLP